MSEIILYDLPSNGNCRSWSLNPWKSRLVLNYKGINYKTQWLEFPDIAPTLKDLGIAHNPTGQTPYTLPTIRLPDGTFAMDSRAIATVLESRYPEHPLHLDSPALAQVEERIPKVTKALFPIFLPRMLGILNPPSEEYARGKFTGAIEQAEKMKGEDTDKAWEGAVGPLKELAGVLKGPFCLGKEVSYADFIILGFLQFCKRADQSYLDRVVEMEPALGHLYAASEEWLAKDT